MSLTSLPEEILRKVLRWATLPQSSSSCSDWPQLPPLDRDSLRLKLALTLVSHQFSRITSEFLYEMLHFSTPASLKSLAAAARRTPDILAALGQRTHYICLLTRIKRWLPDSELAAITDDITFLLSSCTQLRGVSLEISKVLQIERTGGWKKCHDRILSALPAERLRHFEWSFAAPGADCAANTNDAFSNFLRRASNLRVLYCGSLASSSSSAQAALPISLPSLTHLRITADPRADYILPGLEHLPSLTHLSSTVSTNALASSPFWSTPKPSLTSLRLQRTLDRSTLSRVLAISPKLNEITYFYFDGAANSDTWENVEHPTLETVNIQLFAPYCESIVEKAASSSRPETRREKWANFKGHLPVIVKKDQQQSELEHGFLPMLNKVTIGDFASSSWTIEDVREDLEFATSRLRQEGVQVIFR